MKTKKVLKILDAVSNKIEKPTKEIFGYYVKESKLAIIYFFIELFLSISMLSVSTLLLVNNIDKLDSDLIYESSLAIGTGIFFVISAILFFIIVFGIPRLVSRTKNPEYNAVSDIINEFTD